MTATATPPRSLTADFELPGSVSYSGFTEFTFPEHYLDVLFDDPEHDVLHARLSNGIDLLGIMSKRRRGGRACAYFVGRMEPGLHTASIIGLPVKSEPGAMRLLPAISDDPRDYFAKITSDQFAIEFDVSNAKVLEHTAAMQRFKFEMGTARTHSGGFQVNAEMSVTVASHSPYFKYEGYVCLSDQENAPDSIAVHGLTVDFPEVEKVTEQPRESLLMWSGAKHVFRGRVLAQPKVPPAVDPPAQTTAHPDCSDCSHLIDIEDDTPGGPTGERAETGGLINWHPNIQGRPWMKLRAEHWNGFVGPHGGVMGDRSWPFDPDLSSDPFGPGVHMRANPPGTGDAAAFCKHHMDVFYVSPAGHEALMNGLDFEAQRQTAHFERDGSRWIPANHPNAVFYGSIPDYRLGSDTLSFKGGTWVKQGEIKVQDDAHIELGRVIDAMLHTDSEVAFWVFEDQLKAVLKTLADRRGQTRSVGRMLDVCAYGYLMMPEYAEQCREFAIRKARAWFRSLPPGDIDAMQWIMTVDRHPNGYARYLDDYDVAAEGFQNGLALEGIDSWIAIDPTFAEAVDPMFARAVLRTAESLVDEFYTKREFGFGYDHWYTIGWNEDGSKVGEKIHGKNAWATSSDHAFNIQGFAAVAMTFRDTERDDLREKARDIIRTLGPSSWSDARYLGNYADVIAQASAAA